MKKRPEGKLKAVSTGEDVDAQKHYDSWADQYDHDLLIQYGYNAHIQTAEALEAQVKDIGIKIIDLGCGTGLLGKELHNRGFIDIDGVDFSQGMLEKARALNVYQNIFCMDLSRRTDLPEDHYDAAVCAGLFGAGHLGAEDVSEMIRIVKPGGWIIMLMNALPYIDENYPKTFDRFSDQNLWRVQSDVDVNYMDELHRPGKLIVARVC